ncbi:MAG: TonB-dependent receptor [Alphaproteobacteria bacterium]|nr:TonB-dependent receptor [Alphaproteobacteria bacterium]
MSHRKSIALSGVSLAALLITMPAMAQPVQLGPVTVQDNSDKNALNHALPITTMPTTSVQDTPQSITVITGETMKQQAVTNLGDALKNVPGITIAIGEGGTLAGDQFKINGFDAKDDVYLDGLRDFGAYTRDSFNFGEVQVLKGPSGLMFGRGTGGGAINTVSKTPFLDDKYVGHVEGGNGGHFRTTADLNYQLSDTAAVRVNLMYTDTGVVDRDLVHSTRWGIAPSIALGLGTDTNFSLSWLHQQNADRPDYGLVVASPPSSIYAAPVSEFGVPRSTYTGFYEDHDKNTVDLVTAKISHVVTPWLTIENDTRLATYARDFRYTSSDACDNTAASVSGAGVLTTGTNFCNLRLFGIASPGAAAGSFDPAGTLVRTGGSGPYHQNSWGVQNTVSANADFHVGGFHNIAIVGIDAGYQRADRTVYAYSLPNPATYTFALSPAGTNIASRSTIGISLFNNTHVSPPGYAAIYPTPTNLGSDTATSVVQSTADSTDPGLFLTDRFWFTDELSVIGGLRIDQFRANFSSTTVGTAAAPYPVTTFKAPSFLFDPRVSLVYEPDKTQTYYFSWSKAATPIGTSVAGTPTPISSAAQSALRPDKSEIIEAGAKFALFDDQLGVSAAVFNETKSNALQTDPATGTILLQSSQKQRVQGFEASVTGEVLPRLNLTASYTYLSPKITQDLTTPYNQGKQITFVPKNAVSIWGDYNARDFVKGLSFGGGMVYQSHLFNAYTAPTVQPAGTLVPVGYPLGRIVKIPETIEFDAVAAYEIDKIWRVQANLLNVADRLNYSQSFGNRGTPAPGRTVIVSVEAAL